MMARRRNEANDVGSGPLTDPAHAALRLCAVTRTHAEPSMLLRFVVSPAGAIVLDLDRKLPGRGVWLTAERRVLEKAISSKAFARSLKCGVTVPAGLSDQVEQLMRRRTADTLALANKAGLVIAGFQQVDKALEAGKVAALLHGCDAAADGKGKLDRKFRAIRGAERRDFPIVDPLTIEELSLAMGRPSVVHAALIPGGLTERFLREAERLQRFRAPQQAPVTDVSSQDRIEG